MKAFTLYPAVDIRHGKAVRLRQGRSDAETVYDADPVAAASRFAADGSTWLHVVDLDAAFEGGARNRHLIAAIVDRTGVSVQASGGIRSLEDIDASLSFGASRVVVGTRALEDDAFVPAAIEQFGERVAVGLDADGDTLRARGWTVASGDLFHAVERFTDLGVTRFVFTDISRDGMLTGPNLHQLRRVAEATSASVIASGGVASLADLDALRTIHPRVEGAIVGKALYAGRFTLAEALAAVGS